MNLPLPVAMGIWVLIGLVLLTIILLGRRTMRGRDVDEVPALPQVPASWGGDLVPGSDPVPGHDVPGGDAVHPAPTGVAGTYVCTTRAGDWLARLGAHGLGDRAAATVTVRATGPDAGVLIRRLGAPDLFLAAPAITGVTLSAGMAGKVMGVARIVVISWDLENLAVDTGVLPERNRDTEPLRQAVADLVTQRAARQEPAAPSSTVPNPTAMPNPTVQGDGGA